MFKAPACQSARTALVHWLRNSSANVGLTFGLTAAPIMMLTGAAVDYNRMATAAVYIQAAADSAALQGAKTASAKNNEEGKSDALKMVQANLKSRPDIIVTGVTATPNGDNMTMKVDASVKLTFGMLYGTTAKPISVNATSNYVQPGLELALVLDNTGSMSSSNKMNTLQKASIDMINTLSTDPLIGPKLRVSVIPFATVVKYPMSYAGSWWLNMNSSNLGGSLRFSYSWQWDGCVTERDQPYDVSGAAPVSGQTATYYRAAKCTADPEPLIALTNNFTAVKSTISAMSPSGNTNLVAGLSTGLAMLTPGAPFNASSTDTSKNVMRVMVLLTDGENTWSRFGDTDNRTLTLCNAVKKQNIQLYTVRVIDGDASLLRACASSPSNYFEASSASGITDAFIEIGKRLKNLKLIS